MPLLLDTLARMRSQWTAPPAPALLSAERFREVVEQRFHRACHHLKHEEPTAAIPTGIQAAYAEGGEDGGCVHACAIGNDALGRPLTPETPFRIASQSKPITALLALRMLDAGFIDLDAPVWPTLRAWEPTPEQASGFDHRAITLRHLLSHTSGWNLPRLPSWPARSVASAPETLDVLRDAMKLGAEQPARMGATPGVRVEYSAIGYAIVQLALEQAGGERFELLLDQHIVRPLALQTLTVARPRPGDVPVAIGIRPPPENTPGDDAFFLTRAASGMTATASEMARLFSLAAACAGERSDFLRADTARQMFAPSPVSVEGYCFGLGFALAEWPPDALFKHAGYSDGCCGITEGFVGETCAASVQATASHPGGKMVAQRITGAVLEAVREARTRRAESAPG